MLENMNDATASSLSSSSSQLGESSDMTHTTFYATYYSQHRFIVESTLAALAGALNALILGAISVTGGRERSELGGLPRGGQSRRGGGRDQGQCSQRTSVYNML